MGKKKPIKKGIGPKETDRFEKIELYKKQHHLLVGISRIIIYLVAHN